MPMKTPQFWYRKDGERAPFLEYFADGLAPVYQKLHRWNISRQSPYKAEMPVICVGGAVAGGSGKTPVAQALMALVLREGLAKNPAFLTRGYGGRSELMYVADADADDVRAEECGDEALLLAEIAPVIVAKDRATGAKLAAEDGVDLLIMDDGLQNNTLAKDLCVLVVDGVAGFGNGKTIPAGPLREPVASILPRVDACIVIGGEAPKSLNHSNVLTATTETIYKDKLKRVLAFAGLGRPEKFFEALRSAGVNVVGGISFADHHPYSEHEINVLKSEAEHLDAALVTTKKDMVRLKALGLDKGIQVADLTLTFDDEAGVLALLKETLS